LGQAKAVDCAKTLANSRKISGIPPFLAKENGPGDCAPGPVFSVGFGA
jgi:hypothetical protein